MAGARDADGELIVFALEFAHRQDVKQLRMQRASIELKDQVANRRSNRMYTHQVGPGDVAGS